MKNEIDKIQVKNLIGVIEVDSVIMPSDNRYEKTLRDIIKRINVVGLNLFLDPITAAIEYVLTFHLLYRHLLYRHLLYRHLLYYHLLYRHLLYRHLFYRHLFYRHWIIGYLHQHGPHSTYGLLRQAHP